MNIRALKPEDIDRLKEIHKKYYDKDFDFPNFFTHTLCAFIVEDDVTGQIISGGGVKPIAESLILTDKEVSPRQRKYALLQMLDAQLFVTKNMGYEGIHAFVQDEKWSQQMMRYGFRDTVGRSLFIG